MPTPIPFELRIPDHEGKEFDEQMRSIERWAQAAPTGYTLLTSQTLGVAGNFAFSFASMPYSQLRILGILRSSTAALDDFAIINFNNVSSATYAFEQSSAVNATPGAANSYVATGIQNNIPGNTSAANLFGAVECLCYNANATAQAKIGISNSIKLTGTPANDVWLSRGWAIQILTPILSITITAGAAPVTFVAGSSIRIYGVV